MARSGEHGRGGTGLDDLTGAHDGDAAGHLSDDGEVMGDQEHGERVLALQLAKKGENLRLHGDVEGGGRLIGDEEARTVDERHGDEDALALPAGELMRVIAVAERGLRQSDGFKGGDGFPFGLSGGEGRRVSAGAFGDLAADAHDGVEGGHRLLKDHGDLRAADAPHERCRPAKKIDGLMSGRGVPEDLAFSAGDGGKQAHDGEGGGAFSGAGFADEAKHLALIEAETYAMERLSSAKTHPQAAHIEQSTHRPIVEHGRRERDNAQAQ